MSKKISLADWQQQLGADTPSRSSQSNDLVYSTEQGRIKNNEVKPQAKQTFADGAIRLRRETKGRGGKTVLTLYGFDQPEAELQQLCSELKKKCACGGAVKEGVIEIQGDKRELVSQFLKQKGYQVKQAGG